MNNAFIHNARVFFALLRRDMKVFTSTLRGTLIDGMILVATQVTIFGYLFPLMGMHRTLIEPLFISIFIMHLFSIGYNFARTMIFDRQFSRFIDYHSTLPLPKHWLFAEYITKFVIEAFVITMPLFTLGILLLGPQFSLEHANWLAFISCYIVNLLFFGTLFLYFSFAYSFTWFTENLWARRLVPLLCLGCVFYTWKAIADFSPTLAALLLLSPTTYMPEGLRSALLNNNTYLPWTFCMPILLLCCMLNIWGIARSIRKHLDPV